MADKRDRYYCRDCGAAVTDTRGCDARTYGMSVKCPGCGGI